MSFWFAVAHLMAHHQEIARVWALEERVRRQAFVYTWACQHYDAWTNPNWN